HNHDIAVGQPGQCDTPGLVVTGHVDGNAVEGGAVHLLGDDVDEGFGAGHRAEFHGGSGTEDAFARTAAAVGEVQHDSVAVDRNQAGPLVSLFAGEIRS